MPRSNFSKARRMLVDSNICTRRQSRITPFVKRVWVLRAIEGPHLVEGYFGEDVELRDLALTQFPDGKIKNRLPNGRRLSNLLNQHTGFRNPDRVAEFVESLISETYWITCRATDIVRMSLTKHYTSCRAPGRECDDEIVDFLRDHFIAMIVRKDRGGEFLGRQLLRYRPNYPPCSSSRRHPALLVLKRYGNINVNSSIAVCREALIKANIRNVTVEDKRNMDG